MGNKNDRIFNEMEDQGVDAGIFLFSDDDKFTPGLRMIERESRAMVEVYIDGENVVRDKLVLNVYWMSHGDFNEESDIGLEDFPQIKALDTVRNCMAKYDVREILFREYCEINEIMC